MSVILSDDFLIQDQTIKGIADSIRARTGNTDLMPVRAMPNQIANIFDEEAYMDGYARGFNECEESTAALLVTI